MMELSTSTNLVAFMPGRMRNSMPFCIEACARGGYRVLDINFCEAMNPWSRMRDDDWEAYIRELELLGRQWGVQFRQSHLPYYDLFREPSPDPIMEMLIERSLIASAMLGVSWAVTHPSTVYSGDRKTCLDRNISYYSRYVQMAARYGLGICLENDFGTVPEDPEQMLYCADIRELITLVDTLADPDHLGICYDFGHANLCPSVDHEENIRLMGNRLQALHVHDNKGKQDEHLLPFHGNIDWSVCMEALAQNGYKGDLTFEAQEFGRFLPVEQKHLVVEYSRKIGKILLDLYRK